MNKSFYTVLLMFCTCFLISCGDKNEVLFTSIRLSAESLDLLTGEQTKVHAVGIPFKATGILMKWMSENPSVATVNEFGVIEGIAEGATTVTVSYGNVKNSVAVSVWKEEKPEKVALKGKWMFDDAGNLGKAATGSDLEMNGSGFSQVTGANGGNAVHVPKGSNLIARHGISAGSSGKVEEYTLAADIKLPLTGEWFTIFQTDMNNSTDATIFVNKDGKVGVGDLGYSAGVLSAGVWYRLVISVKKNNWFKIYINGELLHEATDSRFNSDRFYLEPSGVILFGDNDGDDWELDVASLAVYGGRDERNTG